MVSSAPVQITGARLIDAPSLHDSPGGIPIALVCMPWSSIQIPSLAMAILKPCAQMAGFAPDLHYLYMRFAEHLGFQEYETIAANSSFHDAEWFFSQALFGPAHLAEIQNGWNDIQSNPAAGVLIRRLLELVGNSKELLIKVVEHVPHFIEDCLSRIDWSRYMVVGFTCTFAQSLASLLLAKRIKDKFPQVKIVFGGANVDSEMGIEFMKGFEWIDYVVHGEAEKSFPMLLNNIAANRRAHIPGVSMRCGKELLRGDADVRPLIDMNDSPVPDYSDYLCALERSGHSKKFTGSLDFESSRGCWWGAKHHCTFCGLNGNAMAYRRKDPERVYSEIIHLARTYRCLKLRAADNILAMDYFKQLLPRLTEADIDLDLFYEVKANLSRAQVKALAEAGVKSIQPGIESFNSRILQMMRKGATASQNIQLLKWCYEYDICPSWNILFGFPGEVPEDYKDLPLIFRLLAHLQPPVSIGPISFDRFSPYFGDRESFRLKLRPMASYQFVFPQSRIALERVAYFFEGEWEGRTADPESYMRPTLDAWQMWKKQFEHRAIYCYFQKGPNYITIYDNRPRIPDTPAICRRLHLNEQISAVYLFCDESHSFRAICDMMHQRFGNDVSEQEIREWLEHLVFQGLMFREDDRYLSLAVRRRPQTLKGHQATPVV